MIQSIFNFNILMIRETAICFEKTKTYPGQNPIGNSCSGNLNQDDGLNSGGKKGQVTRYWERKAMFINQSNNGENNNNNKFPSQGSAPWVAFKMGAAGKSHCSIELERRERREEKQKATISSEKVYAHSPLLGSALRLDICKLFFFYF